MKKKQKPVCCGAMENFAPGQSKVQWYVVESEPNYFVMPYIQTENGKMRVNNCPCCGADVRNVYHENGVMKLANV